ncbi:MAG: hypothetical protein IJX26_03205, partial [Clostridia bacterium]|nr:hypothetical protein [Clostridia bacterium]
LTKYNNYLKFMSQNLPVYITTEALKVVPNGDNGIQSLSYSFNISPEYKLEVFKVFSNVYATYLCILTVSETDELVNSADTSAIRFVSTGGEIKVSPLISTSSEFFDSFGSLYFTNFYKGSVTDDNTNALNIVKKNKLYLEVHYRYSASQIVKVGNFFGENLLNEDGTQSGVNYIEFSTSGTYLIYLKDLAGNTRIWNKGTANQSEYLMLTILPEAIVTVNNDIPVDYAYYNEAVHVSVAYVNSGYYDNGSVKMFAYLNGSTVDYITSIGGRKTNLINNFTFEDYGTYRVVVEAKRNGKDISKTLIFSIINPNEARLALDFTSISKYTITSVVNTTTQINVTNTFNFLINEGFIYSKLITYARLSAENAFGSTMGKQTFTVNYTVENDPLIPARQLSFSFTINNQTPSMQSSIKPGESTTKDITIKFNPQTIYRQVGDCYVTVNDVVVMAITSNNATDRIAELSLTEVGKYTVKIVSDSDRVLSSFQVTIKEPLNSWSILLIIGGILLVVGVVVTFILLRTKMKVR